MWDLQQAIKFLRDRGVPVKRMESPPEPLPGLYDVDGAALTENQMINYAYRLNDGASFAR